MADSFLEASLVVIGDQEVNGGVTHTYVTDHDSFSDDHNFRLS